MNLYIGNIPYATKESELRELFQRFGEVTKVTVIVDHYTNRPKGFAFVEMPSTEEAQKAMREIHQTELGGRKIVVNEARPRENRPFKGNRNFRHFSTNKEGDGNGWYQRTRMGQFDTRRGEPYSDGSYEGR